MLADSKHEWCNTTEQFLNLFRELISELALKLRLSLALPLSIRPAASRQTMCLIVRPENFMEMGQLLHYFHHGTSTLDGGNVMCDTMATNKIFCKSTKLTNL